MSERNNMTSASTAMSDREIMVERVFDAPRAVIWKAWTDPAQIVLWWGPRGFTTTTDEMNVRPGGIWRFVMHGPDGTDYDNLVAYREVVEPERLEYHHGEGEDESDADFDVTVTFADEGGRTRLTMRSLFATVEARETAVRDIGAIAGANQTLDRLGEHLATL